MPVFLRGLVAAPLAGVVTGLLVASPFLLMAIGEPRTLLWFAAYAAGVGLAAGSAVGAPTAVLLALLRDGLRTPGAAALASGGLAALVAGVPLALLTGEPGAGLAAAGACAVVGLVVGPWVVLG